MTFYEIEKNKNEIATDERYLYITEYDTETMPF